MKSIVRVLVLLASISLIFLITWAFYVHAGKSVAIMANLILFSISSAFVAKKNDGKVLRALFFGLFGGILGFAYTLVSSNKKE